MTRLAFTSSAALISMINHGIINSDVTAEDVHNADSIWGPARERKYERTIVERGNWLVTGGLVNYEA